MVTRQEELLERIESALRENREPLENMERSLKQFAGVGKLLNSIEKEVTKTFGEANDLQRKALGIGTSLNRFTSDFSQNINTLNSGITGYSQALKTSFDLYEAGVRRNNDGLATLAQFTKATGGNSKALAGQLAKNLAGAQVSDKELNNLSMNTISLSQRFGVSTEQLVGAINAMGAQLDNLKALNLGAEAIDASQKLSAALGPEMASLGPELLGSFSKGSSMIQTEILNLGNERRAFLAGGEQAAAAGIDLVVEAGAQSQKIIEQFTAGAADSAFALELAGSVYGQEIVKAAKARQQLERKATEAGFKNINEYVKSVKEQQAINTNFTKTLSQLREKIFSPIQEAVTFLAGILIRILELPVIGTLITQLGKIGVIIGTLVTGALGLGLAIKGLYSGTLRLIRSMSDLISGQNRRDKTENALKVAIDQLKNEIRASARREAANKLAAQRGAAPTGGFGAWSREQDIKKAAAETMQRNKANLSMAKLSGGIAVLSTVLAGFTDQLPESMQPVANGLLKTVTAITTLQSVMSTLSLVIGKDISFRSAGKALSKAPGAAKAAVGWLSKLKPMLINGIKLIGPMLLGLGSSLLAGLGAAFSAAIAVLTSPITAIVAAVVGIGVIIYKFRDSIWNAVKWVGNKLKEMGMFIWNGIKSLFSKLNPMNWFGGDDEETTSEGPRMGTGKAKNYGRDIEVKYWHGRDLYNQYTAANDQILDDLLATTKKQYEEAQKQSVETRQQTALAENAEVAREAQLVAARKDPTRPSQLAGVEPTSR